MELKEKFLELLNSTDDISGVIDLIEGYILESIDSLLEFNEAVDISELSILNSYRFLMKAITIGNMGIEFRDENGLSYSLDTISVYDKARILEYLKRNQSGRFSIILK